MDNLRATSRGLALFPRTGQSHATAALAGPDPRMFSLLGLPVPRRPRYVGDPIPAPPSTPFSASLALPKTSCPHARRFSLRLRKGKRGTAGRGPGPVHAGTGWTLFGRNPRKLGMDAGQASWFRITRQSAPRPQSWAWTRAVGRAQSDAAALHPIASFTRPTPGPIDSPADG